MHEDHRGATLAEAVREARAALHDVRRGVGSGRAGHNALLEIDDHQRGGLRIEIDGGHSFENAPFRNWSGEAVNCRRFSSEEK